MKKDNMEKRVVIYCRESRDDYGENYERIETQRDLLLRFCENNGYVNIVDIIMDDDKCGTDFSRFNDIRNRVENNEIDVIVFKNSARLGRNQKEALDFVEYLEQKEVEIIFEDEQYNEEMFGLYAWFNERRARDDSKNIKRNLRHKIEEGKLIVRPIYGYDKMDNKMVVNIKTSKIVRKIFELYIKGNSYNDIAHYLNNNGVLTPSQEKGYINAQKSEKWNNQNIIRILSDRRYTGDYVGGYTEKISFKSKKIKIKDIKDWTIIPNNHEPIISKETFYKAQEIRHKNERDTEKRKKLNDDIYLKYMYCGKCNSKMYIKKGRNKNSKKTDSYICKKYSIEGREEKQNGGCKSHRIRKEYIDIAIKKHIREFINSDLFIEYAVKNISILNQTRKEINDRLNGQKQGLEKLKEIYMQIYDDKLNGVIPIYLFNDKKKELDKEIAEKEEKIIELRKQLMNNGDLKNIKQIIVEEIKDIMQRGLTNEELSIVLDKIIVFEEKEISNEQKGLYNLNDMMYNEMYKKGGIIVIFNKNKS